MKRIILAALVGVLVSGLAPPAAGQNAKDGILMGIRRVYVKLTDSVNSGCLPNPSAIKNAIELKLLANGFKVVEKDRAFLVPILNVVLLGGLLKAGGQETGCVVHILMTLEDYTAVKVPYSLKDGKDSVMDFTSIQVWGNGYLLGGPKEGLSLSVKSQVEDFTDEMILKILKTRQEMFAKYPYMKKNFERVSR